MEFLKEILGDELYAQFAEKIKGNEKVQIVNAKDGTYIPKAKFDALNDEVKSLKGTVTERDKQLKELAGAKDISAELKTKIEELQNANKQATKEHEKTIEKIKMDHAIKLALTEAKDPKEILPHLDMAKIKLGDDGTLIGMKEQLDPLKEERSYLFRGQEPGSGINPGAKGPKGDLSKYKADYSAALEQGDKIGAIMIKQAAFNDGIEI